VDQRARKQPWSGADRANAASVGFGIGERKRRTAVNIGDPTQRAIPDACPKGRATVSTGFTIGATQRVACAAPAFFRRSIKGMHTREHRLLQPQ
jgi:hypothetical protein